MLKSFELRQHFRLGTVLTGLSRALDLSSSGMWRHHGAVAVACQRIGHAVGLSREELETLCGAALIHDLGASAESESSAVESRTTAADRWHLHAQAGAHRLRHSALLRPYAEPVRHHHDRWDGTTPGGLRGEEIPLASRIISLADQFCLRLAHQRLPIGSERAALEEARAGAGTLYDPRLVECLADLTRKESFVLDLASDVAPTLVAQLPMPATTGVEIDELVAIARVFAEVIDGKCSFTRRHSTFVSVVAARLGRALGFSSTESQMLEVAGLLHDIGKLVVPGEILASPRKLTPLEYNVMRAHPYYTLHVLRAIDGFETIAYWAALHHERLDGKGYPFQLTGSDLPLGAQVVSMADFTAALCEERSYRPAMSHDRVRAEIMARADEGAFAPFLAKLTCDQLGDFAAAWSEPAEPQLAAG